MEIVVGDLDFAFVVTAAVGFLGQKGPAVNSPSLRLKITF